MKSTEQFKLTIKAYLDNKAETDLLFTEKYNNEKKNIDDCITYILNTVQESGCNGFADEEIYGMAVHYYDEESIGIGKEISCRIAVNHTVELTKDEKADIRKKAIEKYQDDIIAEMKRKSAKKREKAREKVEQPSLF